MNGKPEKEKPHIDHHNDSVRKKVKKLSDNNLIKELGKECNEPGPRRGYLDEDSMVERKALSRILKLLSGK